MNPTQFVRSHLEAYSAQLKGLGLVGENSGRKNFLFGPSVEFSDVLITAMRNVAVYPLLMLEYPDSTTDDNSRTGTVERLSFGLSVLANVSAREEKQDIEGVIYGLCKPLLDQVIARLQYDSDERDLKDGCSFELHLENDYSGIWVGPVANNVYGYRYSVNFRVYGRSFVFQPEMWNI
ncbi:hypothetical protein [Runella zeae]|uniref:hypothetical protein n=1 Tax=Runella zeae TaxID=94255 RepID=UPI002352721E|nr:hypothetical protein [Runella zeae]